MFTTERIQRHDLGRLPESVLTLLEMGQYSLYSVKVADNPEAAYILRTGARKAFFLNNAGELIEVSNPEDCEVLSKVEIPCSKNLVTSNSRLLI